jgi:hypothetical protein
VTGSRRRSPAGRTNVQRGLRNGLGQSHGGWSIPPLTAKVLRPAARKQVLALGSRLRNEVATRSLLCCSARSGRSASRCSSRARPAITTARSRSRRSTGCGTTLMSKTSARRSGVLNAGAAAARVLIRNRGCGWAHLCQSGRRHRLPYWAPFLREEEGAAVLAAFRGRECGT